MLRRTYCPKSRDRGLLVSRIRSLKYKDKGQRGHDLDDTFSENCRLVIVFTLPPRRSIPSEKVLKCGELGGLQEYKGW